MENNSLLDKLKGAANKAKGEIKVQVGQATDNTQLEVEGKLEKAKGEAQEKMAEAKDRLHDKIR